MEKTFHINESLVVKSNTLIMSRYNLSLAEQRLILQVVSMINKDDEDFKDYTVYVSEYLDLIGSRSSNTYKIIKEFSETLLKKPLHIPRDNGGFLICNWFSSLEYEPKKGMLNCRFDPALKPYLLQLKKNFTMYKLKNILSLSSKYSIRLYEILKRYEGLGSLLIDLIEFRKLLAIPDSYLYRDIKRRILKPLQKDFKSHTDISFDFEEIKSVRKVTAIKFTIKSNLKILEEDQKELLSAKRPTQDQLSMLLNNLPKEQRTRTAEEMLAFYLQKHDVDYIKHQIEYVNKQKPKNYFAYLKKAIEEDYADNEKVGIEEKKNAIKKKYEAQIERIKKLKQEKGKKVKLREINNNVYYFNDVFFDEENLVIYEDVASVDDEYSNSVAVAKLKLDDEKIIQNALNVIEEKLKNS